MGTFAWEHVAIALVCTYCSQTSELEMQNISENLIGTLL